MKIKAEILKRTLHFSFFIFLFNFSIAQQLQFKNFKVNDGLPSTQVYDITQDKNGYLWFATDRGLAKYNGYEFETFDLKDGLPDITVLRFTYHPNGNIWCTTLSNRLFYIDENSNFVTYEFNFKVNKIIGEHTISEMMFFNENIYIGFVGLSGYLSINEKGDILSKPSGDKGYYIVNDKIGKQKISYKSPSIFIDSIKPLSPKSLIFKLPLSGRSISFYETMSIGNTALISSEESLFWLNSDTIKNISGDQFPIGIGQYDSIHFWVGFRYGGYKLYDLNGNETGHFLDGKSVTHLEKDIEGGIWTSTLNSGVFFARNSFISLYKFDMKGSNHVHSLTSNEKKELFVGYYNGSVFMWNGKESEQVYTSKNDKPALVQYYKDKNSVIVGVENKIFDLKSPETYYNSTIISFAEDSESGILFGTHRNILKLDKLLESTIVDQRIGDVCKGNGKYYVGTLNGIFTLEDDILVSLDKGELLKFRVDDIDENKGKFYCASLGAGLIVFDDDTIFSIDVEKGLSSNLITEVLVENDSTVWTCGIKGLNRVVFHQNNSFSVLGFSNEDGIVDNEVFDIEIIDNIVWVATSAGLCSFNKSLIDNKAPIKSNYFLSLNKVKVNDEIVNVSFLSDLAHYQNRLDIEFLAISYKYEKKLQYRYQLENLEKKWNYTYSRKASYPSLTPGNYKFVLQVKNEFGNWDQNQLSFSIRIAPPYYKTWWFISLLVLLVAILVYMFFRFNVLSYNKDISRELLRKLLKFMNRNSKYILIKEQGKEVKIKTLDILFVKASGNYLDICTVNGVFTIREKISSFMKLAPDSIEFMRVHRSYIVRLDKVTKEDKKTLVIGDVHIPIGEKYKDSFKKILV